MECEVLADTKVSDTVSAQLHVIWKKDNVDMGQPGFEENDRVFKDNNNTLVLNNINLNDSGKLYLRTVATLLFSPFV